MDVQVIAVRYPTNTVSKVPHGLKSVKRFSFVSDVDMRRLVTMRPTEEVDPRTLRELLKKQRRLATGSEQQAAEPRPTVQISKDELLGLRDQCSDDLAISVEPAPVEPARGEPAHVEAAHVDAAHVEEHVESARVELEHVEPESSEPAHVDRGMYAVAMERIDTTAPSRREPRARKIVIGTAIACLATLWLAATGWLLATW